MIFKFSKTLVIIGCFSIVSCTEQKPDFDYTGWKNDGDGCTQKRIDLVDDLLKIKAFFQKKSEKQIASYLGKPDNTELNKRHTKTFIYYLDKNPAKCQTTPLTNYSEVIAIEFNSLGITSIISKQVRPNK